VRPNKPIQPTPLCGPKIVAILAFSDATRLRRQLKRKPLGGTIYP